MNGVLPICYISLQVVFKLIVAKGDKLNVSTRVRNSNTNLFKCQERNKEIDYCVYGIPKTFREKSDKSFERPRR